MTAGSRALWGGGGGAVGVLGRERGGRCAHDMVAAPLWPVVSPVSLASVLRAGSVVDGLARAPCEFRPPSGLTRGCGGMLQWWPRRVVSSSEALEDLSSSWFQCLAVER